MSRSPPHKRQKSSPSLPAQAVSPPSSSTASVPTSIPAPVSVPAPYSPPTPLAPKANADPVAQPPPSPSNPRKRQASHSPKLNTLPPGTTLPRPSEASSNLSIPSLLTEDSTKKRGRTNTPWTAQEEQRLKQMRDSGLSWSEIAKAFPARTEGSVKKHWYKDMHYAEFAEDESVALREAIREYEANKWKAIGQKLGKPAKACEQYAKEHFKSL